MVELRQEDTRQMSGRKKKKESREIKLRVRGEEDLKRLSGVRRMINKKPEKFNALSLTTVDCSVPKY